MTRIYTQAKSLCRIHFVALAFTAMLIGCGAVSGIVETSKKLTATLTGADDPNNTSALAQAGRMQNAGTDAVAGVIGVKPAPAETQPIPTTTPAPVVGVAEPPIASNRSQNTSRETMSISEMQTILLSLGYQSGAVDGAIGKRTVDALKKFQQANKLPSTGILDADTAARLRSARRGN